MPALSAQGFDVGDKGSCGLVVEQRQPSGQVASLWGNFGKASLDRRKVRLRQDGPQ